MTALIVFTDLDGTLLHSQTYTYEAALPVLARLQQAGIPVIPVTSKTRAEVETLIEAIGLTDPFVVENGSAIYFRRQSGLLPLPDGEDQGPYRVMPLGGSYVMARAGLKAIAQVIGQPLKGFGDLSVEQIQHLTGLETVDAKQAKQREFTEPFLTPKNTPPERLRAAAAEMGFKVVVGDRFSHLIGASAGKGVAVQTLVHLYRATLAPDTPLLTVGLGNSPNDLDLLEAVERAIILPGESGPHPQLAQRGWPVAPAPAPEGWAQVVSELLTELAVNG